MSGWRSRLEGGDGSKLVCLWDTATGKLLGKYSLPVADFSPEHVVFSPDGIILAIVGATSSLNSSTVCLLHLATGNVVTVTKNIQPHPGAIIFSGDGRYLAVSAAGPAPLLKVFEVATGKLLWQHPVPNHQKGKASLVLAASPDGRTLLARPAMRSFFGT